MIFKLTNKKRKLLLNINCDLLHTICAIIALLGLGNLLLRIQFVCVCQTNFGQKLQFVSICTLIYELVTSFKQKLKFVSIQALNAFHH